MSRVAIIPSRASDVEHFSNKPPPYTLNALTAVLDGEVIGMGGTARLPDGTLMAFLELKPGANRYAVTLHKTALRIMREAKERGARRILATADPSIEAAPRWLERLGFKPTTVEGETIYLCQV